MTGLMRDRIEAWFAALGRWVFDHRWITLLVVAVIAVPLLIQLPTLTIDNRTERMFLEGDPALEAYRSFRDQFGTDEFIVVAVNPPQVFDVGFLERLRALHREIEAETPHVAEVTSLINARNTYGEADTLIVEDLLESWPTNEADIESLRQRVMANPFYRGSLVSADATFTTIMIKPRTVAAQPDADFLDGFDDGVEPSGTTIDVLGGQLTSLEFSEMVTAVRGIAERHRAPDFPIYLAGGPVVTDAINRAVPRDLTKLMPLSTLAVAVCLWFLFWRASGVIYPLLIVWISLFSTLGLMALVHIPMSNITTMLASFLTVVGVADSVHIMSMFYQRLSEHGDARTAIAEALHHSGLAVLMTSVTTAVGLLSFVVADVRPIAELGIVAPIGVIFALFFTVMLLPALLAVFPAPKRTLVRRSQRLDRFLAGVARVSCTHSGKILAVAVIVALIAVAGMARLRFSQNGLKWFKEHATVRTATELVDRKLGGTLTVEVVVDTGKTDGLIEPDFLRQLESSMTWAEGVDHGDVVVAKATSLETVLKEINRALHGNEEAHYAIPDDRNLIAQELLLFEGTGSNDLEELVDNDFQMVRCTLMVPFRDAFRYVDFLDEVAEHFAQAFPDTEITITGSNALFVKMFNNVITTMAKSYVISLSVITVLMVVLLGRLRIGLLSMVPNLLPLIAILGIMGWMRIPLDMSTVLIGSIAIGLVVDDTIHFMHNFRRDFEYFGNVPQAVERTLDTAGRAILITSIVLAAGFYACLVSELRSSIIYGGLMGTTVVMALVADYFVTPALMNVVFGRSPAQGEMPGPGLQEGSIT
ncbi:MAG: RND family transporter [bacterium]|nr:RND family transporter [bacterium]